MTHYFNKLLDLEEHIFILLKKRKIKLEETNNLKEKYDSIKDTNDNYNHNVNDYDYDNYNITNIDVNYIIKNINIQLEFNKDIVEIYNEFHDSKLLLLDIDIINLIVKYIDICGKIVKIEIKDMCGIKEIEYTPNDTIHYLKTEYIIDKYSEKVMRFITESTLLKMRFIFLNIIIPYSENYMLSI